MIRIHYSDRRLRGNLFLGSSFFIVGAILVARHYVFGPFNTFSLTALGGGFMGAGAFLLMVNVFERYRGYLSFRNGRLVKHALISKSIALDRLESVRYFVGEYKLKTRDQELSVNTEFMDPESLEIFRQELSKWTTSLEEPDE